MKQVVCPELHAAQVGRDILTSGGNVMDAAVAAAFVQCVTNPINCGIGGGGTFYVRDGRTGEGTILNAEGMIGSVEVPAIWGSQVQHRSGDSFRFQLSSRENESGYKAVLVPAFVRGCAVALDKFGSKSLSWADLLEPAIRLASDGFELTAYSAHFWELAQRDREHPTLARTAEVESIFLKPGGAIFSAGDRFVQTDLAATLRRIADEGPEDFYSGKIATLMSQDFADHQGLLTARDLRGYSVDVDEPLHGRYRHYDLEAQPFSNGANLLELFHILNHFDLAALEHNSPRFVDLVAQAMRASFADHERIAGGGRSWRLKLERDLVGEARAEHWASVIKRGERIRPDVAGMQRGTTHLVVADSDGTVVQFNHSIGAGGSGVLTNGLGFLYNGDMAHFNPELGHFNSAVPGKKMYGGSPLMVSQNGTPFLAIGAPGGTRIVTSIVQAVINVVDFHMDMQTSVTAPRFHSQDGDVIFVEPTFAKEVVGAIAALGNTVMRSRYGARPQAIRFRADYGEMEAGSDPRDGRPADVGRFPSAELATDPAFESRSVPSG